VFLLELGIVSGLAEHAAKQYPDDCYAAFEYVEAHGSEDVVDWDKHIESMTQRETVYKAAWSVLKQAGYDEALLSTGSKTSVVSVDGNSDKYELLAKRRQNTRVERIVMPTENTYVHYVKRASQEWPDNCWNVHDCGIHAALHPNACFWSSVVTAWSRLPLREYSQDPELNQLAKDVHCLKRSSLSFLIKARPFTGDDMLGKCAHRLRELVAGCHGYMRKHEML
jgi:hypothetical protein